jgi:hypothetical protein
MQTFSTLLVVAVIIGIIVYCVSKKKENEIAAKEKAESEERERLKKQQEKERGREKLKTQWDRKKETLVTNGLPIIDPGTLNLTKNEVCHFMGNACFCKIKEETIGYEGGSRGVSFRVTKGMSLKFGNYKGHSVKATTTKRTEGLIYLTSKKVVFSAISNSCIIKYDKIVTLNAFDNILQIQTEEKSYLFEVKDDFNFLLILECILDIR